MTEKQPKARASIEQKLKKLQSQVKRLQASEKKNKERLTMLLQLLDQARHGMYIEDIEGNSMLYVNPACARFFGTDQETMTRSPRSWIDPIHPDDLERIMANTKRVSEDPDWQFLEDEYRLNQPDGNILWVRDVTVPIRDEKGELIRSAGIIEDITERKQAVDDLHEWSRKIELLHEITRQMAVAESEKFVYLLTIESARRILGLTTCHISSINNGQLETEAASTGTESMEKLFLSLSNAHILQLVSRKETVFVDSTHPSWDPKMEKFGYNSILRTPIGSRGIFQSVAKRTLPHNSNVIRMLELLLGHTYEAVNRIQLQNTLKQQALHDPLTGVFNRYYLNVYLRQELKRSERYHRKIGFLMIDVDEFKRINDECGHVTGDEILKEIARITQNSVRESDTVIRYGGDEFLAILPETNGEVTIVKDRIHQCVEKDKKMSKFTGFKVTVSIGSAHWDPQGDETLESVIALSDQRMYEEKRKKQS